MSNVAKRLNIVTLELMKYEDANSFICDLANEIIVMDNRAAIRMRLLTEIKWLIGTKGDSSTLLNDVVAPDLSHNDENFVKNKIQLISDFDTIKLNLIHSWVDNYIM